ncbi:glycosyltransferase family 28 protein [Ancylostoma ceylanicum]|uniref:glucuronosyltransferase n=1 Tax=Ancylostoma ceylanicum TaxID=53326 RepID=A0A0D6M6H1_9BILA|nr:glycosyltransferase family 28 protein [Ancylostoma ceylanicum]
MALMEVLHHWREECPWRVFYRVLGLRMDMRKLTLRLTIYSSILDPHVTTFGNRLPAHTIFFKPEGFSNDWLKLEMKGPLVWEAPPCEGMCMKWSDFDQIVEQTYKLCKAILKDDVLLGRLRNSKFELVFSECFDACAPGIWEMIGIKNIVLVSALGMMPRLYDITGMPTVSSFMPVGLTPYSDEMTFMERVVNFNLDIVFQYYKYTLDNKFWKLFNDKIPGFPTFEQIYNLKEGKNSNLCGNDKTALIMTNVNEFAETARPTTNMIRYIGGSTLHEPKPLSKELSELLNKNPTTILISMGSLAQSKDMPTWLKKADPRLSLFITHGGMNSILEAMHYGKPMIVVPLFADQQLNSKAVERRGMGIILERHLLNKKTLTEALKHVMGSKIGCEYDNGIGSISITKVSLQRNSSQMCSRSFDSCWKAEAVSSGNRQMGKDHN